MQTRARRLRGFGVLPMVLMVAGLPITGCSSGRDDLGNASASSELEEAAPDPTGFGPEATTTSEYRFEPAVDPDVLGDRATEIWASITRPKALTGKAHPLLVFLHGNHATCGKDGTSPRVDDNVQYTTQGTCPPGYTVVANHRGYDYVSERLASWGYVVVSINANRGITAAGGVSGDQGLNLARGRLVLRHLELLSGWNRSAGTTPASLGVDLAGTLDFGQVGMMGHSRGGEGVRAAYNQYVDAGSAWPARIGDPLRVRGIFEIGPVDGQTGRKLDALGTAWSVLLPMCDGDVRNLQGMLPYDRMLAANDESRATPKSMFGVWGANHNYYNTEWQQTDSNGCSGPGNAALFSGSAGGSTKQQATGLHAMMAFFRGHVGEGANTEYDKVFDPRYASAESLSTITRVQRAYSDSVDDDHVVTVEDFTAGDGQSKAGLPTIASNVTVTHSEVPEHDRALRAAALKWSEAGPETSYQVDWAKPGEGVDITAKRTFDFRVSRQRKGNPAGVTNFSVQLVHDDGSVSRAVQVSEYVELHDPVGARYPQYNCGPDYCYTTMSVQPGPGHVVLETARVPLTAFAEANLARVRGVRFVFDDTPSGAIYLTGLRFSRSALETRRPLDPGTFAPLEEQAPPPPETVVISGNQITALRQPAADAPLQVELRSDTAFPVTDDFVRLRIGERETVASRYADDGDTHRILFTVAPEDVAAVADGAPVLVRYGAESPGMQYDFGALRKGDIQRR